MMYDVSDLLRPSYRSIMTDSDLNGPPFHFSVPGVTVCQVCLIIERDVCLSTSSYVVCIHTVYPGQ